MSHRRARAIVAAVAAAVSCVATIVVYATHNNGYQGDEASHLLDARRVVDSATPGFAQIGQYWPPMFHILELPFALIRPLYDAGLSGTIPAMLMYVVGVVGAFELGTALTGRRMAGAVGALAYGLNPNLLVIQSLSMMESTIAATLVWSAASLARFWQTGRMRDAVLSGLCVAAAVWADYGAWVLPVYAGAVIAVGSYRHRHSRSRAELYGLAAGVAGFGAMGLWLLWGFYIQHDPLYFAHLGLGANSTRELELALSQGQAGSASFNAGEKHNLAFATLDYGLAVWHMLGPVATLGCVGAVAVAIVRGRIVHPLGAAACVGLFTLLALFMFGGTVGSPTLVRLTGNPLPSAGNDNIRYGLFLLPLAAGVLAVVAGTTRKRQLMTAAAVVLSAAWLFTNTALLLPRPDQLVDFRAEDAIAAIVAHEYDGTLVLTSSAIHGDRIIWRSGLDGSDFITENNGALFAEVASHPRTVGWVLVAHDTPLARSFTDVHLLSLGFQRVAYVDAGGNADLRYALWKRA